MRGSSVFTLTLLAGLLVTGAAFASPAAVGQALPAWLADTPTAPAAAIGTPVPTPMAFLCTQPPTTFCQSAQCQCQQRGGYCLCGGFLSGCNESAHTFSCICRQC
jgi:hypothetical protein